MISERLERGESVRWHDGTQWHVGNVLRSPAFPMEVAWCKLVQTATGAYFVSSELLEPYPPRCKTCGGEGRCMVPIVDPSAMTTSDGFMIDCPECGGSGRQRT